MNNMVNYLYLNEFPSNNFSGKFVVYAESENKVYYNTRPGGGVIDSRCIYDDSGNIILDDNGNYILLDI